MQRIWELISAFFGGIVNIFERLVTQFFGSSNERLVKQYAKQVNEINSLEQRYEGMSDTELADQTSRFKQRLAAGETLDQILFEAFAVCREAGRRFLGMRHYDVQLIGGMVLHEGKIAEMITGEGKTLVATLPAYLNALTSRGVHVVTVNDYLARRDMEWMAPLYQGLGLSVGAIQSNMDVRTRQAAYGCNITYGTNNEFGFDYLRDNMRPAAHGDDRFPKHLQQSQGKLFYAIVDEVDNILIDEARTPLIISGPAHQNIKKYGEVDKVARQLKKDVHFTVDEKGHNVLLNDDGIREAERLAGVESFYTAGNMDWPHMLDNALKAHYLYKRDVNYVIQDGKIVIVDEFTGRLMEGRQWSDGLHQAVEASEGVKIKEETQTLATITLQNYFRLYEKISGMTGTALTEATEFYKTYEMEVVAIPPNRPLQRIEHKDIIYLTEREKYKAVCEEIESTVKWDVIETKREYFIGKIIKETDDSYEMELRGSRKSDVINKSDVISVSRKGRPVLVGTVSIEKSEHISKLLKERGIDHEILNAKNHGREAEIIAQAGRTGAVTIATNMAGRGTDILLGGNPETLAWSQLQHTYPTRLDVPQDEWDDLVRNIDQEFGMSEQGEEVKILGGLHVIGTERHDARRIDLQLRGRCGRQGDPGSSRFFLSIEDDLMRIFGGIKMKDWLQRFGMSESDKIESGLVTRRISGAQKKVEERNFEIRRNLLEYDKVMDLQRKEIYSYRQRILDGDDVSELVQQIIADQVDGALESLLDPMYGLESLSAWINTQFGCDSMARDFKGHNYEGVCEEAKSIARKKIKSEIHDKMDETVPRDADPVDYNWETLTKFVNTRFQASIRSSALKEIDELDLFDEIMGYADEWLNRVDLSDAQVFLESTFQHQTLLAWLNSKYGIALQLDDLNGMNDGEISELIHDRTSEMYFQKEAEYPVLAALYRFGSAGDGGRIDREGLIEWAQTRFDAKIDLSDVQNQQREETRDFLLDLSLANQKRRQDHRNWVDEKLESLYGSFSSDERVANVANEGELAQLAMWLRDHLSHDISVDDLGNLDNRELSITLRSAVDEKHHPEMRRMERGLLLEVVDAAWKDHLLAMDYLKSSVGLQGYAQKDPKVEYQREGMTLFRKLWISIGDRVTDLLFRMEQLDEGFVGSTWVESSARHDSAVSSSDIAREQQDAIASSQDQGGPIEPTRIHNRTPGRNEPCFCGSGKKYKRCCMGKSNDNLA